MSGLMSVGKRYACFVCHEKFHSELSVVTKFLMRVLFRHFHSAFFLDLDDFDDLKDVDEFDEFDDLDFEDFEDFEGSAKFLGGLPVLPSSCLPFGRLNVNDTSP